MQSLRGKWLCTKKVPLCGEPVPEVLLSGNHGAIAQWRQEQQIERTRQRRPDLYARWLEDEGGDRSPSDA